MLLTDELLAELRQAVATGQLDLGQVQAVRDGRSPLRPRQLHDLRLLPTKDDPRPTYFFQEAPRNDPSVHQTHPVPRLLWTRGGEEVTVRSLADYADLKAQGYLDVPPGTVVVDQAAVMQAMLDGLSETDKALVLDGAKAARNTERIAALMALDDDAFATLVTAFEPVPVGKAKKSA